MGLPPQAGHREKNKGEIAKKKKRKCTRKFWIRTQVQLLAPGAQRNQMDKNELNFCAFYDPGNHQPGLKEAVILGTR